MSSRLEEAEAYEVFEEMEGHYGVQEEFYVREFSTRKMEEVAYYLKSTDFEDAVAIDERVGQGSWLVVQSSDLGGAPPVTYGNHMFAARGPPYDLDASLIIPNCRSCYIRGLATSLHRCQSQGCYFGALGILRYQPAIVVST